ncbi:MULTISPECIES: hypothetical protein [unclassified Streptomyces]|uniref:hypothetical protein n=1 Tax=unclassified Streptomyces TaxID=2593676 RepID=UPI0037BC92CC
MSDKEPVDPYGIPVFTGDLAVLGQKVTALAGDGENIATAAGDIHSSFGGLQAFYRAPEADQLFATTKPVAYRGDALKWDLARITGALGAYADDAQPLVAKLKRLKREASTFLDEANADDKWREDGDLVEENNRRRGEIAEAWAAFQTVERTCYNKIIALVPGGKPLKTDDGSGGKHMHGYDAEVLKQAKGLPWGDPVKESTPWWQVHEHAWDFTKGFVVDGVLATVRGLGTLAGFDGWDAAKQAWTGLGNLTAGIVLTVAAPHVLWATPEKHLPGFARDARKAMTETGKALIAYDQWSENPARAGGAVTFNVLTTVFTGGTGGAVSGAGKAAAAAKALSLANKAGRFVDPTTYLFKGASTGLTKISDVMAGLKGMGNVEIPPLPPGTIFTLPEGGIRLPDGTVSLPEGTAIPDGAVRLPDGTVKLPDGFTALPEGTIRSPLDRGPAYMGRDGNLYNEDGSIAQRAEDAQAEKGSERTGATPSRIETPEPALIGAGRTAHSDPGIPFRTDSNLGDGLNIPERAGGSRPSHQAPENSVGGGGRGEGFNGGSLEPPANHGRSSEPVAERPGASANDIGGGHPGGSHHSPDAPGGPNGGFMDEPAVGRPDGQPQDQSSGLPENPNSTYVNSLNHPPLEAASAVRPDGARYIEEPSEYSGRIFDEIRATPDSVDLPVISERTGISEGVLQRVKTHMFRTEHVVVSGKGVSREGLFTPRDDIADLWQAALHRELDGAESVRFQRLMAHEYMESHLMKAGLPYLYDNPQSWTVDMVNGVADGHYRAWPSSWRDAGAHELTISERRGGFAQWERLGLQAPKLELTPDLSNIDEVMEAAFQALRSNGIELK